MNVWGRRPIVMIVERDLAVRRRFLECLHGQSSLADDLAELVTKMPGGPIVVLAGPSCADAPPVLIQELCDDPLVGFVAVGWDPRSGPRMTDAVHPLPLDADDDEITAAIQRCRIRLSSCSRRSSSLGRVTAIASPKGGAGKTTVAINLAAALARRNSGPVVLVDCDLAFGDVAVNLGISPDYDVFNAIEVVSDCGLDEEQLGRFLVRHRPSGLLILAAPSEPAYASRIFGDDLVAVVDVLRRMCDHVVLDTAATFDDVSVALARSADDVVVVADLEVSSIKNAKLGLQVLSFLGVADDQVHLVINRADTNAPVDCTDIEAALGRAPVVQIPSQPAVSASMNTGDLVVVSDPDCAAARAFTALSVLLSMDPPESADGVP